MGYFFFAFFARQNDLSAIWSSLGQGQILKTIDVAPFWEGTRICAKTWIDNEELLMPKISSSLFLPIQCDTSGNTYVFHFFPMKCRSLPDFCSLESIQWHPKCWRQIGAGIGMAILFVALTACTGIFFAIKGRRTGWPGGQVCQDGDRLHFGWWLSHFSPHFQP